MAEWYTWVLEPSRLRDHYAAGVRYSGMSIGVNFSQGRDARYDQADFVKRILEFVKQEDLTPHFFAAEDAPMSAGLARALNEAVRDPTVEHPA